ncbi:MAG TPA: HEAT repeat domain-containing protein, partial [Planctomycetes bacterium]|nr:HEAT repeat domain-containing protein [Planctomycetota bacterium]
DLESVVTEDPDETVRVFALEAIAEASTPDVATRCDWLRPALEDESPVVRAKALELACGLGDPRAIDRAIADLGENPRRLQAALLALRDPLADPALSERAYAALLDRNRLEEHRPLIERGATFKAMGIVQLQKAARFLRDMALANLEERIEGLRAHEWLMIQASNTGPAGRIWLWEQLEVETDPLRRIDLISASCSTQDPDERAAVRNRLLVLAEDDRRAVGERLYAADRAAKIGPAWIVAPRLRLVANSTQETRLQLALQCLLWHWY